MKNEIKSQIKEIKTVLQGEPWFGRAVYELLEETDETKVYLKPADTEHSLIELLYHMLTWTEFTVNRVAGKKEKDLKAMENLDWRTIDPAIHSWKKGLIEFKSANTTLLKLLAAKEDSFLDDKVDYRNYNFRFLINGMIQHTIYHLGQVAYLNKLVAGIPQKRG
jgi:uncharacterized damage-inducible protein DinB